MSVIAATAIVATAGVGVSPAQASVSLRTTLQHDANQLIAYGAPGVLVGVDGPGRDDLKVRSGYGNVAQKTPVPWDTEFRIGSNTKTYVSATLLQLVGEGRLSLNDTIEHWLPGVVQGNGNDGSKITIREMLQHTAGIPEYLREVPYLFDEQGFEEHKFDTLTAEQAVALAMKLPPDFAPGTSWNYSNTDYALAGMIIHKITGHTWQQEVQARIIKPLGLRHTYTPDTSPTIPGPHAVGYERFPGPNATDTDPDYGDPIDATVLNPSWGGAAGEMISTTDDDNTFLQALIGGRVLKPAQLAEMEKTVPVNAEFNTNWPGARYGLGLMWIPNSCGGSWSHGGDIQGFQTRNGVSPDGKRSVIVTINTDTLVPKPGVTAPPTDVTLPVIDHALCGH
jgi:D-alanyl-D-alanine carboxypeptidase